MFDVSMWAWYGAGLIVAYITLMWFGFAERKREKPGEKESRVTPKRHETTERYLDQSRRNTTKDEHSEVVASSRESSREDVSGLRWRARDSSVNETVAAEENVVSVQCMAVLENQNYNLEADKPADEETKSSPGEQNAVLERFASQRAVAVIENGLQLLSERFAHVDGEGESSEPQRTDCKLERGEQDTSGKIFSAFANDLVINTMLDAFQSFNAASAGEFALNLSSKILRDALSEMKEGNVDQVGQKKDFSSFIPVVGDNASTKQNIQIFAQDFSEQLLNEGLDAVAMKEADIVKIEKFSDSFISNVITDGTLEAGVSLKTPVVEESKPNLPPAIPISEHAEQLTSQLCQMAYKEVILSTSLRSSVTGVVENLVNGAIFEAVSKVKEHGASIDEQDGRAETKKSNDSCPDKDQDIPNPAGVIADGLVAGAMNEVAALFHLGNQSESSVRKCDQMLNGHTEKLESAAATECNNNLQGAVVRRTPSQSKNAEQQENGGGDKHSGFWRQSLLLDLEEDVDYDDNSSEASCEKILDAGRQGKGVPADHCSSDEDSSEFIDSSEDEIIDHAEEAKLGAVGGTRNPVAHSAPQWDEDEDLEDFEPEVTVDGLCMSRPNERKRKSLPRARVQSVDSHFNQPVILDNGSGIIKLGMSGDKRPTVIQPAVIGTPQRYSLQMTGMDHKKHLKYGDVAMGAAGVMHLGYPMSAGLIDNWADIEDLWEYLLYDNLGIEEGSHPVLVTEVADNHQKNREKIGEILFEHLSVPAMYLVNQLSLSLYASGLTTGVCLSSGFSVTQAAVIYEGHILKHTIQQLDIAGQGLTNNLKQLMRDNKGHNFPSSSGWQIVNTMKERLAYISTDFDAEMEQYKTNAGLTTHYKLPDGQMIDVHGEQIQSVEPLFAPSTLMSANDTVASQSPVHKLVHDAMRRCDSEVQDMCYRNIVLSGGSTKLSGLVPRLENELRRLNPKIRKLRAPDNRDLSPWIGGSILASLSTFDTMFVTVDEYADSGARVVNQKCF